MVYEIEWFPRADEAMDAVESDESQADALAAVRRTLGQLELDPFDPKRGTRSFQTQEYGHVRSTPCRFGDWEIYWCTRPDNDMGIQIVMVAAVSP